MSSYRQSRGVDTSLGAKTSLDDKRAQWNMITTGRVLENLFPEIRGADGTVLDNRNLKKAPKYTADTLAQRAREYFENIYESNEQGVPIIPDIEDFCMFAKLTRLEFQNICNGNSVEMARVGHNVRNAIALCKKQLAFTGQIPPVVFAIDFNNNHDYIQSKNQLEVKAEYAIDAQESINEIASRLPQLEPRNPQIEE